MNNYLEYSADDFIMDPAFQEWVQNPDAEGNKFWNDFQNQYPAKKNELLAAKLFLSTSLFDNNLSFTEKEELWQKVDAKIQKENEGKLVMMNKKKPFTKRFSIPAAAVLLALAAFFVIQNYSSNKQTMQLAATKYGETKTIQLPDSSLVTLNANSKIQFVPGKNGIMNREVWVEGEAYFAVKHTASNQNFVVHTTNLDIEVLGTEFNVMQRDSVLKISLNSGKIKLNMHRNDLKSMFMLPGEMVEVSLRDNSIKKQEENIENLIAWKNNKLVWEDTSLSDILGQLKHLYGWQFEVADNGLLRETITGEVPTNDQEELLRTLEVGFHITITKKGESYTITRIIDRH